VRASRALLLVALLQSGCLGPPPTVDRITIANPTDYQLGVDVTGEDRQGWLPLTTLEPRSEYTVGEVIDQGQIWIFRFLYLGDPVGEVSVTRDELEGNGWRVVVPDEVERRLRELGDQPSG
jgi:hypothetical protein